MPVLAGNVPPVGPKQEASSITKGQSPRREERRGEERKAVQQGAATRRDTLYAPCTEGQAPRRNCLRRLPLETACSRLPLTACLLPPAQMDGRRDGEERMPCTRHSDAACEQGRKHNEKAREALEQAVRLDGQLAEAYTNLGIALQDLGQGEEAERMTGLAVRLKPEMAAGHNNHGRALENNNKLEAALSSYNEALQLSGQGYADAFCAKVYLEHFLCAWDSLDADMVQVANYLQDNLAPQYATAEPCVQPFRAFAYPLPPTLFMNVTIKVCLNPKLKPST